MLRNLVSHQCHLLEKCFIEIIEDDRDALLRLLVEDPDTFAMLVQWIYHDKLPSAKIGEAEKPQVSFYDHLRLCYLASRFKITRLQSETMQQLRTLYCVIRDKLPINVNTILGLRVPSQLFVDLTAMGQRWIF